MKIMFSKLIFVALIVVFSPVGAQPRQPFTSAPGAIPSPESMIRNSIQRIQAFIAEEAFAHPARVNAFLEREIAPAFDFYAMSALALGSLHYHVNAQQRQGVTNMVKRSFLQTLASNLGHYRGGRIGSIRIINTARPDKISVRLAIYVPGQYPTVIELRSALGPEGWKIIDVSANGVSAVAYYRNYIHSLAQKFGVAALPLE